ncbi:MAG TPA: TIGR03667 family PPOX class F420-dependent oxidoreductase [Candidatus Dormibacteraeota bacterium]|nr:TIGR03667 family PPOX class F420-dependent oxidoreductase [Candidatus Dormibacteraeota bacterium]
MPAKHVVTRLKRELVIWLATADRDGHPHAVPVWFWWDGKSVLIYSVPGQKVRDVQSNPNVVLHLNTDPVGEDVVRIDGTAIIDLTQPPAYRVPGYVRKYRDQIKGFDWTPKVFSDQYHFAILVKPTRFH